MYDMYILCEKSSAYDNFKAALGGATGTFEGQTYLLGHSHGHLMTLEEPEKQVDDPQESIRLASWSDLDAIPWNIDRFKWTKTYIKSKNPKTKRMQSTKTDIDAIKRQASNCKTFVIATDNDPSGEGDLLGWEIVNAIGWKKPVYRIRFSDEGKPAIRKALHDKYNVTEQNKQGEYIKGEARNRFDFASMQETRLATYAARQNGYNVKVIRVGRLKSYIIKLIADRLNEIDNYVKKPYYEVRYQDSHKHIFKRKYVEDQSDFRITDKAKAQIELQSFATDQIVDVKKTRKKQAPGSLIDLSTLTSMLSAKGFNSDDVINVYQLMYEAEVVSYPRTEDTAITQGQFNDLLPLVDHIANLVGIDPAKLTHRTLRSKHLAKAAAHGANRPGLKPPVSLSELATYDREAKAKAGTAEAIYMTLAKNYLSILGEDYEYDVVTAHLANHPNFVTQFNVPVKMNYKDIFNENAKKDQKMNGDATLDTTAEPFLYEGSNKKPSQPTLTFVMSTLKRNDIGTGATRVSTYNALKTGANKELTEVKGKIKLTEIGRINASLLENTYIADGKVTKQLLDAMNEVGKFKRSPVDIMTMLNAIVKHDKPIFAKNGTQLMQKVGKPSKTLASKFVAKDKVSVHYKNQIVQISSSWGGHKFTQAELKQLESGQKIIIECVSKAGKPFKCEGHLGQSTYKGRKFYGFIKDRFV